MIYYSSIPHELAFYDWGTSIELKEIQIADVPLLVQMDNEGVGTIVRLLSLDPNHYLESKFQPGQKIQFFPNI